MIPPYAELVPRRPTEYMRDNVFFGASGASAFEAAQAVASGIEANLLWGSDYPHLEGTFVYADDPSMPSVTKLSLRNSFCLVPEEPARQMVGLNAVDVYGLDGEALAAVAARIGAPSAAELASPIDAVPEGAAGFAFRSGSGTWR